MRSLSLQPAVTSSLLALACVAVVSSARAHTSVMVETDPSTFVFSGFAVHARVAPDDGHWVGGAGAYALDFPSALVDMNSANRDQGWDVRLQIGGAAFVDYSFAPGARGWFVGVETALQSYRYRNAATPGSEANALNVVVMPRAGYQWHPFDAGLYVTPWIGLGVQTQVSGSRSVGDKEYSLSPWIPYGAVHVGWQW
jgi:hypothetical protein